MSVGAETGHGTETGQGTGSDETKRFVHLDRGECMALLGTVPVGRIAYTERALPAIQPVNFLLHRGEILLRVAAGSALAVASRNAIVAFEVDDFDEESRTGWSVAVVGSSRHVTDESECARLAALPLQPWAPGERDQFVLIEPTMVTGRRIEA